MDMSLCLDKFNPQQSAEILKVKIGNYSKMTVEIVEELHKAKDFYSNRGRRTDLLTNGSKLNSFKDFLEYIGLYEQKAYRWLERYVPQENKLLTYEEFSKIKAAEAERLADEKAAANRARLSEEERTREIISIYRKTGRKVAGWTSRHDEIIKKDDEAFIKQQERIDKLKQEQNQKPNQSNFNTEKISSDARDALRIATDLIFSKAKERQDWKEKIRLSDGGKEDAFMDALVDYLETLPSDNRRIEACNNIIKICRNISVELQRTAA
jgi:hypothetical protein